MRPPQRAVLFSGGVKLWALMKSSSTFRASASFGRSERFACFWSGLDPDYHRALGQFIEAFAGCEGIIFSVLTFYAGVSIPVAKALFARTRMDGAIEGPRLCCFCASAAVGRRVLGE